MSKQRPSPRTLTASTVGTCPIHVLSKLVGHPRIGSLPSTVAIPDLPIVTCCEREFFG